MFTWILQSSLRNRLFVVIASLVVMVYGAFTLSQTAVDVFPDLNKPTVTIMTEAGGMAAEEVEQLITFPLESSINGLPGVEGIRSVSSAGLSFLYVTFGWEMDLYRARQLVSERINTMEAVLPGGVVPHMGPISSVMGEIMQIAIPIDPSKISLMQVREYADWVLRPRLMSIPGVAQVIPIGGEVRQFQVQPDTLRMANLGITYGDLESALRGFSANTSGGFLELNDREYLIRNLGQTSKLNDLRNIAVSIRDGQVITLQQIASVEFAAAIKRGDAGFGGKPAVILGVQKQPTADTIALTESVELALDELKAGLPSGMESPRVTFRQASFIEASINNLNGKLIAASAFVALTLFVFLGTLRPTIIALTAIPVSICVTALVFAYFGLTINTMTLGGLAIAIGGLVDDAIVDVENIIRRLRMNNLTQVTHRLHPLEVVRRASFEVRSGILYATVIIVLVFFPLFFLPGIEGRLFIPLGIAFIASTLASLLVSVTITPVLAYYLIPSMKSLDDGDTPFLTWLKRQYASILERVMHRPERALRTGLLGVVIAIAAVPFFPTSFLPPFNEGTLLLGLRLNPGVTLSQSSVIASEAERLVAKVPEVAYVGRRSGRAELDEHAEGVHVSEIDIGLIPSHEMTRSMTEIKTDIREQLRNIPAAISIGQPISHRIDHMLSGVRAQIAIKIYGEDLDQLRAQAESLRASLAQVPGIADLEVEKQVLAPQIKIRVDQQRAAQYGLSSAHLTSVLQSLVGGETLAQIVEQGRRFALVVRIPEAARGPQGLGNLMIDTPQGRVPLSRLAEIEESDGPNQISRDDGKRRIVLSANTQGRALSSVVEDIRKVTSQVRLPEGFYITIGGQFEAQERASRLVMLLSIVSLVLMFVVLHARYKSWRLSALVMANIPLALVGSVIGLAASGQPLSIAALIGFVTLAGISVRNGILKVSHYLNLMQQEGERFDKQMILRGSLERLAPVLMTALVTALALAPLLFEAEQPGTEILHPVAVVIFCGLLSATLLDSFLMPVMFWMYGRADAERLIRENESENF